MNPPDFDPPTDDALLMALLVLSAPGSLPTPATVRPRLPAPRAATGRPYPVRLHRD